MHIEIVRSNTKGLSSMSQISCDAIYKVLIKNFIEVGVSEVNNLQDLENLVSSNPDLVLLGMEFIPENPNLGLADPNKIWLSDYFDRNGIAYTGSNRIAHMLQRDKPLAKQRILDCNLQTPAYLVIKQHQIYSINDINLSYPLFIKPTNRGGGLGIDNLSVVHNYYQLRRKVNYITHELSTDSLIEEYLPGREYSVAILKDYFLNENIAMPIELVAPQGDDGVRLLSSQVKSSNTEIALEVTDKNIKSKVSTLALEVFTALGARDYGRIDIRLDSSGAPNFLEANLIPSLISGYGSFPKACVINAGLDYESMIMTIVNLGLTRCVNDLEVIHADTFINELILDSPEASYIPI